MSEQDDQEKIRKLLKSQPMMKPPESFYQGIRRRIESRNAERRGFLWGAPFKAIASACIVLLVVWVAKEKQPIMRQADLPASESLADGNAGARFEAKNPVRSETPLKGLLKVAPAQAPRALDEKADLRRMVSQVENAPRLNERTDVHLQARDMGGVASQNSFSVTDQLKAKEEKTSSGYVPGKGGAKKAKDSPAQKLLKDEWLICATDADCSLVPEPGTCNCPCNVAINKKFAGEYQKLNTEYCRQNPSSVPCNKLCADARPVCTEGRCNLLIKN
jgi:hypothetical protein